LKIIIPERIKQAEIPKGIIKNTLLLSSQRSENNPIRIPPKNTPKSNNDTIALDSLPLTF